MTVSSYKAIDVAEGKASPGETISFAFLDLAASILDDGAPLKLVSEGLLSAWITLHIKTGYGADQMVALLNNVAGQIPAATAHLKAAEAFDGASGCLIASARTPAAAP